MKHRAGWIILIVLSTACGDDSGGGGWKSEFGKPVSISLEVNATIMVAGGGRTLRLYPCVTTDQGKLYPYELNEVVFFCNNLKLDVNTYSPDEPGNYHFTATFKSITSEILTIPAREDLEYDVIEIPLAFHIYESSNQTVKVTQENIKTIVKNLNSVFRRTKGTIGYNDQPSGIDTYIQFRLAKYDTLNQLFEEEGILRHTNADMNLAFQFHYNLNMRSYLNVHVFSDAKEGHAFGPFSLGNNTFPGINLLSDETGVYYDLDKVDADYFQQGVSIPNNISFSDKGVFMLAHEIGHLFGLHHVFDRTEENPEEDDFCPDTYYYNYPNGKSNRYCGWDINSPISPLRGHSNSMDYEGPGTNMEFTYDQRERMRWVLDNSPWLNELKYSQQ